MSKNINLLPRKPLEGNEDDALLRLLKRGATYMLIFTLGSSLVLFLLTITSPLSAVKEQENNVMTNLSFSQGKIAKYLFIKDRAGAIKSILAKRYPMDTTLETLLEQIPADVSIDAMRLENKSLEMTLSAASLDRLDVAFSNMTALLQNHKLFNQITLHSISGTSTSGKYVLTMKAILL